MTNWRDFNDPDRPDPIAPGHPESTPQAPAVHWRDLADPAPAPDTPPASAPVPEAPPPPAPAEAGGTEATGWEHPAAQTVTPATPQTVQPGSVDDPAEAAAAVGMRLAAAGGAATSVDPAELLRQVQALQARVAAMEADQRAAEAPAVVAYATGLADHLQAKADANPVIHADPDHTYMPALRKAAALVNTAQAVAVGGGAGHEKIVTAANELGAWLTRHHRRFPNLDYSYLLELAEDAASAALKLAA